MKGFFVTVVAALFTAAVYVELVGVLASMMSK